MTAIQERYQPVAIGVNGTAKVGVNVAGFLAVTSGTLTLTVAGVALISAVPVTAGTYLPLPFVTGDPNASITLGGGASGVAAV